MPRTIVLLLASVAAFPAFAQQAEPPAQKQPAPTAGAGQTEEPTDVDETGDGESDESVVVVGQRPRGSVVGDNPAENTLNSRDIRATGATTIQELLDAIAPQTGSARGRGGEAPVLLVNGRRISGFRELRDVPPEAIERVDILPEEVALKYGYAADQKVVNFVLRRRFYSTVARADGKAATEGGYVGGAADATRTSIRNDTRTTLNLHGEANSRLNEDEREIRLEDPAGFDTRPFRSLTGSKDLIRATGTVSRTILGDVAATLNGELQHSDGKSGLGFEDVPLLRDTSSNTAHLGLSANKDSGRWRYTVTGNADWSRNVTTSDRDADTTDRAESTQTSGDLTGLASGPLFDLPAGRANVTLKLSGDTTNLETERRRDNVSGTNKLGRDRVDASANLDVPILKNSPIGRLGANGNVEVEHLSDFGTLTTVGAGINWSPKNNLNLIASWTREEGAPTMQQIGDPILDTPDTRVFDFTTGESVLVTSVTGGNPNLNSDRRTVWKLGGNWKPFEDKDLRVRADYVHSVIQDPISSFPGPSAELEAAFPERFVRDADGSLIAVDLRPVNYEQSRRDTLRWGIDFSKPLKSARPTPSQIAALRARFRPLAGATPPQAGSSQEGAPPPPPEGSVPPPPPGGGPPPGAEGGRGGSGGPGPGGGGPGGFGGGGGFRGGGFFGGGQNRGRLTFSFTHTINLVDNAVIGPGLKLDYLHGDAVGSTGGRPRHELEFQAGYANNGLGARLSGDWRSATRVDGDTANGDLKFSSLATFNLRLFANLGERLDLVAKHPWLIGTSVNFGIDNLLDSKPNVRNALGDVPFSYQEDLLDPIGRTVSISFRKLFLPQRFRARSNASSTTR